MLCEGRQESSFDGGFHFTLIRTMERSWVPLDKDSEEHCLSVTKPIEQADVNCNSLSLAPSIIIECIIYRGSENDRELKLRHAEQKEAEKEADDMYRDTLL